MECFLIEWGQLILQESYDKWKKKNDTEIEYWRISTEREGSLFITVEYTEKSIVFEKSGCLSKRSW